jgi:PAS domain S-box-containing protein
MPEAIAVFDASYRFIWVNGAMESFIGLPREKILGETCHALLHRTRGPIPGCLFRRTMESLRRESMELDLPEKRMWVKVTVDPIIDDGGRIAGAIHYISDITPVKEAERAAIRQSGRLVSLMNNVPGVVYRGLPDWSVSFIGSNVERITGYTQAEFLSGAVSWREFIHPDDLETVKRTFREAVHGKRSVLRVEYRARHKDGSIRWIADRRQLIHDAEGNFVHVDGLLLDITDRKGSDEALRISEERYHSLFDNMLEGFAYCRMLIEDGKYRDFVYLDVNPAFERLTGLKDALGKRVTDVIPGIRETNPELFEIYGRVASTGNPERFETFVDALGSWFSVSVYSPEKGFFVSVFDNITGRRTLEEQLRQSQKMEAIGRLAGGVAHDFNNLLTAIGGYSDLLIHRLDGSSPMRRDVEEIRKAGERATSLTRQLLAFSRQQVLRPKALDFNAAVADIDRMLRRLIGEDIDLVTVLKPGLGNVMADPGQIEQVIMNLVVNARDAMPRGGKLTIETRNVELDTRYVCRHPVVHPGAYVLLSISDTGCGMDEVTKERLFEPFYTTKEKGKGTGLGLSTVYGIVKQSGGYIWVYSEIGLGTTFKVYFPRFAGASPEANQERASESAPRGRETVLVAEDEEMVRTLVRGILEGNGYTVLTASDGDEAISAAGKYGDPIHLILTDVVMPKRGGRDVAESLARFHPGAKVLYMSGYTDESIVHHGVLEEGIAFIEKPFTPDALLRKVRQVLAGPGNG